MNGRPPSEEMVSVLTGWLLGNWGLGGGTPGGGGGGGAPRGGGGGGVGNPLLRTGGGLLGELERG